MAAPPDPMICHITRVENLASVIAHGGLLSDAAQRRGDFRAANIGYSHIKARRMARVVPLPPGGTLGDYVPFNFCSRSVMLYVVAQGHQDYDGGEDRVVHLVSYVSRVIAAGVRWMFTDRHAELAHAGFFDRVEDLDQIAWDAVRRKKWNTPPEVKEMKQAELLVHERFPWEAVAGIAVKSDALAAEVTASLASIGHKPRVRSKPDWYYRSP